MQIKHCKKCLMPNTRPGSLFNEEGVCQACLNYEKRETINWEERMQQLKELCDSNRRDDGYYDCLIPVSGGKDSHFLVHIMKEKMKMNPLLVTVGDPFTKTRAGASNLRNLKETFNCDHLQFDLSIDLFRRATRLAFEKFGEPLRFVEAVIYTMPIRLAVKLGISLMVYGENSAYEYGSSKEDNSSAKEYIKNIFKRYSPGFWQQEGFSKKELNSLVAPTDEELEKIEPIFMSYFDPWSSTKHLKIARKFGFQDLAHEWKREGYIEDFEQIDSVAYIIHLWLKYPKFGFQRVSDVASRYVREGILTKEKAKQLIEENDHKIDQKAFDDFINFCGYTHKEFWDIVDKFWNPELFIKVGDIWQPRFSYDE